MNKCIGVELKFYKRNAEKTRVKQNKKITLNGLSIIIQNSTICQQCSN